ncbi:MAG: ATP-dependent helicase [Verrucomicrobiales bacterium]|nr:ATP-dependent helicase [Verrucomicrobiales bacterium]
MSSSRANRQDTAADRELYDCLNATPPRSFLMIAGAGSGKTTSLIKGLMEILAKHGGRMKQRRQKVACITYTEVAAGEIWADVGQNPLAHVSTIHSFLWVLVRAFQSDIHAWVTNRIDERLTELRETARNYGPRVQRRTRDKNQRDILRYEQQQARIGKIRSFTYGTGSDYVKGILGHDDIINMVPDIITARPLMRRLVAQQFPFLFVDESQDTTEKVVTALKAVDREQGVGFCLGFFGDPMQRIYMTGIGDVSAETGWSIIKKPENFRCPTSVLRVANAIRRDGDGLIQTRGRTATVEGADQTVPGSAHLFILPADDRRDERLRQVRAWAAREHSDPAWQAGESVDAVKLLVIVHRMAAKRLGFGDLYAALNDKAPDKFKNGFLDGTAWPIRPFFNFVMPLVNAANNGREFEVMQLLRTRSPLMDPQNLGGVNMVGRLAELRRITQALQDMLKPGATATVANALLLLRDSQILLLDPRVLSYLESSQQNEVKTDDTADEPANDDDGAELTREVASMGAFLRCPASQFCGFYCYVNDASPFSTQQGVKGAEFERVLVVLDDDEGTHVQFSYDKYLGIKPLSERDEDNRREGKETAIERTRRLFYVCCTRATKDLVVVLFTEDIETARQRLLSRAIFPESSIHLEDGLPNASDGGSQLASTPV